MWDWASALGPGVDDSNAVVFGGCASGRVSGGRGVEERAKREEVVFVAPGMGAWGRHGEFVM
jgi:hypothetical protein